MTNKNIEERVVEGKNGYYEAQIRFLPVEDWEQNDGWRTCYTSLSEDKCKEFLN